MRYSFLAPCCYVSEERRYVLDWTMMCIFSGRTFYTLWEPKQQLHYARATYSLTANKEQDFKWPVHHLLGMTFLQVTQIITFEVTIEHYFLLLGWQHRHVGLQNFSSLHCSSPYCKMKIIVIHNLNVDEHLHLVSV